MARTYTKNMNSDEGSSFELDLAPMLALMVTLIPMLLLSTVFVQIVVIDTPLPQAVQQALENDRSKKEREVLVKLNMAQKNGFQLQVTVDGKVNQNITIPKTKDGWDIERLHTKLISVKKGHPKVFRLDLNPGKNVPYVDIVKVMDAARNTKKSEGKISIMDEKTKKPVETDLMFPDVVFANVVEG